jgi:Predicted pyridoxal phosphate-dependent enzyme apparently involved in regulation of cell wall biogenesis
MMGAVGGYFELADYEEGIFPYQNGILLNTGRNALEYILRCIDGIKGIYLPYYTCEVVLEPLKKLNIPWFFYHINARFEIDDEINLKEGEYIIVNNYYGIKDAYIRSIAEKYGDHIIVDCAQAFFAKPIPGIKAFYSMRKFVGVADGGVAFIGNIPVDRVKVTEIELTSDHDSHLLKRKNYGAEAGFADFQKNETKLDNQPIRWMSSTTKRILDHINYDIVVEKRRNNYSILSNALSMKNFLALPDIDSFVCPMVYPFVTHYDRNLRKELIENKVFVARYWPNVLQLSDYEMEYDLASRIVPLPCDQRYGEREMKRIIDIINY